MELSDELHAEIASLSEQGNSYFDARDFPQAINCFATALELLPQPRNEWEAFTWLCVALGDTYFAMENWKDALGWFQQAASDPESSANPFILLRTGQCFFELNDLSSALQYLLRAFAAEGVDIFREEEPKYLSFVRSSINRIKDE